MAGFDFGNIANRTNRLSVSDFTASSTPTTATKEIALNLIDTFENHPFSVRDDEDMDHLVASVKENGIMTPAIVRPKEDGSERYELISGHRRKRACELAGLTTLRCEIKSMTDEQATVIMVDSNLQREKILPSERGKAYKMKHTALEEKLKKQNVPYGRINSVIGDMFGEGKDTVRRYIRLTYLLPEILELVDENKISMLAGVALSYIDEFKQKILTPYILQYADRITVAKAEEIRDYTKQYGSRHDDEALHALFNDDLKPKKKKGSRPATPTAIKFKQIKSYIPNTILKEDYEDYVIQALLYYRDFAPKGE